MPVPNQSLSVSDARTLLNTLRSQNLVVLPSSRYNALLEEIESLQDALALLRAVATSKKLVPYTTVHKRLVAKGFLK
jgi:hypothetical protein